MIHVFFVCLGNICRSPLAEGIFRDLVAEKKLYDKISCDSAGTSNYHIGHSPDPRTVRNALQNMIKLNHKAQQFAYKHFHSSDYIIVMDKSNLDNIEILRDQQGLENVKIMLMRAFDREGENQDVPDPYFGGEDGFQEVFEILNRSCRNLLHYLIKEHQLET